MTFGQQSGPPATARQLQRLTSLVVEAGHADLRDARGALGLTQRQAGGRFTRDEADALIARLETEAESADSGEIDESGNGAGDSARAGMDAARAESAARYDRRDDGRRKTLSKMPAEVLAAELQRRGWVVMEP